MLLMSSVHQHRALLRADLRTVQESAGGKSFELR